MGANYAVQGAEPLREQQKHLFFHLLLIQPHLCLLSHHSAISRHHLLVSEVAVSKYSLAPCWQTLNPFSTGLAGKQLSQTSGLLWAEKLSPVVPDLSCCGLESAHRSYSLSTAAVGRWVMPEGSDASQTSLHRRDWLLVAVDALPLCQISYRILRSSRTALPRVTGVIGFVLLSLSL